tara:strand:+ start:791 stop:1051 length:261 start_codon:yes stop_codon:yes gene_type:complete
MYTLGKQTGYDNNTTNSYTSLLDYLPTASWGYSKGFTSGSVGLIDYIDNNRDYYTCTLITTAQPKTWDVWAQNWENITTNWENEIL